jgi:hypothetical protein
MFYNNLFLIKYIFNIYKSQFKKIKFDIFNILKNEQNKK